MKLQSRSCSLVFTLVFFQLVACTLGQLKLGFYTTTCPNAESIVSGIVQKRFAADNSITAAFLRMHFHDCFVRGCDASILIDSTSNKASEKSAGPNLTVHGYEIIDEIKTALEKQCPSIVSCADILTLATRDAVSFAGGPKYNVPTGRRDGLVSDPNQVDLPGPDLTVKQAAQAFAAKGFTLAEMVTLLGAHTVGVAHCTFFRDRLFNFQGVAGKVDPSMEPALVAKLKRVCGSKDLPLSSDKTVFLDQNTSFVLDNEFYNQVQKKRGILVIDQELSLDKSSSGLVSALASDRAGFMQKLEVALVKMGKVQVLVGNAGEIRKNCRVFNKAAK